MANLIITALCNRSCKFCFAKRRLDEMKRQKKSIHMPFDHIIQIFDYLKDSGVQVIGILGGEPTLHPQFIPIIEEAQKRRFHLKLFSNGIMGPGKVDFLSKLKPGSTSIICNISDFEVDSPSKQAKRDHALKQLGQSVTLGITISEPDVGYTYLIDFIKRYGLNKRIRVGVAQPIVGQDNAYFPPARYPELGETIVRMAKDCIKEGIIIGFDCGMTLCMFTEEQLGILMTHTEGFKSVCNPIIDIGPDQEVWSCFPLSEVYRTKLTAYPSRQAIHDYYQRVFGPYRSLGCRPECLTCVFMRRGQCKGGCIAHAINAMNRKPPRFVAEQAFAELTA